MSNVSCGGNDPSAAHTASADDRPPTGSFAIEDLDVDEDSCYWDPTTMAPLNAISAAAVARLRAFKAPPFPLWDRLPLSRRAAVLLLLYTDRRGDLHVVITMRAATLRSFSGQAALPGGKADTLEETPYQIARREAYEEIGLPQDDARMPPPFCVEHLCDMPLTISRNNIAVRPCVALLTHSAGDDVDGSPSADETLIPQLDAREVAAVFTAPFHNFLRTTDERHASSRPLPPGAWYEGGWTSSHGKPFPMHYFHVPVDPTKVIRPRASNEHLVAMAENAENDDELEVDEDAARFKVWGMTARVLVDAAIVAYGESPEFEHSTHLGDENILEEAYKLGRLEEKKRVEVPDVLNKTKDEPSKI